MIDRFLKTIAAGLLALGATQATAGTVSFTQVGGSTIAGQNAVISVDLRLPGPDAVTDGTVPFVFDFFMVFSAPGGVRAASFTDTTGVPDTAFTLQTNLDPGTLTFGLGSVAPVFTPIAVPTFTDLLGSVGGPTGIDTFDIVFETSVAGVYDVIVGGSYSVFDPALGLLPEFIGGQVPESFQIVVVDPSVIPLPAGGVLMLTGAGMLVALRRRSKRA